MQRSIDQLVFRVESAIVSVVDPLPTQVVCPSLESLLLPTEEIEGLDEIVNKEGNRDELLPRCYARLRLLPLRLDPPRPLLLIRLLLHIHVLELILVEHPRAQRGTHSRGGQPAGAEEQ